MRATVPLLLTGTVRLFSFPEVGVVPPSHDPVLRIPDGGVVGQMISFAEVGTLVGGHQIPEIVAWPRSPRETVVDMHTVRA